MAAWFDPVLALLAAQPPATTTLTLTLGELAALASGPVPAGLATRTYWRTPSNQIGRRLAAIGWRTASFNRRVQTITFSRFGPVLEPPGGEVV